MREYGMIYSAFWTSTATQGFSDDAKMLGAYLLSCSHGTIAGACRLSDGYVSDDLNWVTERVSKGFAELLDKGFADRCETTKWVWIRKFLEWNKPENPNQWKAVWKVAGQIPSQCSWLSEFIEVLRRLTGKTPEPPANPSGRVAATVSKSHTHSDTHSDTHSQPNTSGGLTPGSDEATAQCAALAMHHDDSPGEGGDAPQTERGGTDTPRARPRPESADGQCQLQSPSAAHETLRAVQAAYPAGLHRGDHWGNADHHLQRLVELGVKPETLVQAAADYAAQQSAEGTLGTGAVKRPNNFFGTDAWKGPFPMPQVADKQASEREQRLARTAAELQALVEGRAVRGLLDFREPYANEDAATYATQLRLEEQARRGRPASDLSSIVTDLVAQKRVAS